ncbi:molybdate ABC transporter substrate-binding protein [Yinghuangia seranimata]|uniref:molybdate ABC transporter substrate-binding protein n=1 Tax=Yinghuangia seranimata TaxID=408067 RepID=UPI00248B240F|nr:molybdate ABC transporter substrate-binding protein [Yinghuangia seranimata]MDI2128877.1 molybdate ABC transporter substrate-binding protein [Yinghuangia seranimata]
MRSLRTAAAPIAAAAAATLLLAACGSDDKNDAKKDAATSAAPGTGSQAPADKPASTITVLAAASLTAAFNDAGAAYTKNHKDQNVKFSFAGSQELAAQVKQGAPADLIATADTKTMDGLAAQVVNPQVFAKNRLAIVVAPGNPKKINGLADLAKSDVTTVLAGPTVPVGRYARDALTKAGVEVKPKSEETDVKAVLTRVRMGEADAGIVYTTDIKSAGDAVASVDIPDNVNVVATYPVAVIKDSKQTDAANAFAAWLLTPEAQDILKKYGFASK